MMMIFMSCKFNFVKLIYCVIIDLFLALGMMLIELLCGSLEAAEIKLIDFGSACMDFRIVYKYIQVLNAADWLLDMYSFSVYLCKVFSDNSLA